MIQWLKEKFVAWLQALVILTIVIAGIAGGIVGAGPVHGAMKFIVFLIGAAVACFFALLYCVVVYGFIATVISIAKSSEENTKLLAEIKSKLSDLAVIKNKLNELDDISAKPSSAESFDGGHNVRVGNKVFAVKDGEAGKYFCPKCHVQVVETAFSCSNCNASLVAD